MTKKYVEFEFVQFDSNYLTNEFDYYSFEAIQCDKEKHFGKNKQTRKHYDDLYGYSLICPNLNKTHDFTIRGDASTPF